MRVGFGYDVHRLVEDRDLILGGVKIPYEKGLLGHSDADVLLHAIMDALLGAAALGDIGRHFPDTDPAYKGISSLRLLEHVGELLSQESYQIINLDATIIAQRPKMAPHISQMVEQVARTLKIDKSQVNIKATKNKIAVTVKGELKRTSSLIGKTRILMDEIEKEVKQLLGTDEQVKVSVKYTGYQAPTNKYQTNEHARVE